MENRVRSSLDLLSHNENREFNEHDFELANQSAQTQPTPDYASIFLSWFGKFAFLIIMELHLNSMLC